MAFARTLCVVALLTACSAAERDGKGEPPGRMPEVVTTAEPEWIPFRPLTGRRVVGDPRETTLSELRRVTDGGGARRVEWMAGDRALAVEIEESGCGHVERIDLSSGAVVRYGGDDSVDDRLVGPLPDGRILVLRRSCAAKTGDLRHFVAIGKEGAEPLPALGSASAASLTSAGTELFVAARGRDAPRRVLSLRLPSFEALPVTATRGVERAPAFASDGSRAAWIEDGRLHVSHGRGAEPRALSGVLVGLDAPAFDPKGRLVFAASVDGPSRFPAEEAYGTDLWMIDPDAPPAAGGHPPLVRVTFVAGFDGAPRFSRSGEYLAWVSARGGGADAKRNVYVAYLSP